MSLSKAISPEEVIKIFVDGWNEKNAKKIASVFVEDADFVNVTGLWWRNKERIFKAHDYGLKVIFKNADLEIVRIKTRILSETSAILHCKMKLINQTSLEGQEKPQPRTNRIICVVQKIEANWKAVAFQNTEVLSGKETFIVDKDGNATGVNYGKYKGN